MPGIKTNERPGTRAVLRHYRMSATKARQVLDLIRGLDVDRAHEVLRATPREGARVVAKVLESAVANARTNDQMDPEELYVSACYADEGTTVKRWRPRARGRATRIRKRTCHVTVIVSRLPEDRLARRRARAAASSSALRSRRVAASRRGAAEAAEEEAPPAATEETPEHALVEEEEPAADGVEPQGAPEVHDEGEGEPEALVEPEPLASEDEEATTAEPELSPAAVVEEQEEQEEAELEAPAPPAAEAEEAPSILRPRTRRARKTKTTEPAGSDEATEESDE